MHKNRLEAFSDGVLAIIITIMVLELKVPHDGEWAALVPLFPVFLSYVLSFIYIGIYWNNHHHLFQAVRNVNGSILWANMHLLFWLSLTPFTTAWAGENHFAAAPTVAYGFVLLMCGTAYYLLTRVLVAKDGERSLLATAVGSDRKGKLSVVLYALGIGLAFYLPVLAYIIYALVALIWFVPDQRLEKVIKNSAS